MKKLNEKIIINSDNCQRDAWYDLVESGGLYHIMYQKNRSGAKIRYIPISQEFAERLIELAKTDLEAAIEKMRQEVQCS